MKIVGAGSREWTDAGHVYRVLAEYASESPIVAHGTARGADRLIDQAALALGYQVLPFAAHWSRYGKRAGIIRNREMLDTVHPDLVIVFWDGKSRGTADLLAAAYDRYIPCRIERMTP
jgi:hypothetical protein